MGNKRRIKSSRLSKKQALQRREAAKESKKLRLAKSLRENTPSKSDHDLDDAEISSQEIIKSTQEPSTIQCSITMNQRKKQKPYMGIKKRQNKHRENLTKAREALRKIRGPREKLNKENEFTYTSHNDTPNLTQNVEEAGTSTSNVEEASTSTCNVDPLIMEVSEEVVPRKRIPKPKGSRELKGLGQVLRKSRRQEKQEALRKKEEKRQLKLREKERKLKEELQRKKEANDDLLTYMNCLGELSPHYLKLTAKKQRMFRLAAIMFLNEMLDEKEAETETPETTETTETEQLS